MSKLMKVVRSHEIDLMSFIFKSPEIYDQDDPWQFIQDQLGYENRQATKQLIASMIFNRNSREGIEYERVLNRFPEILDEDMIIKRIMVDDSFVVQLEEDDEGTSYTKEVIGVSDWMRSGDVYRIVLPGYSRLDLDKVQFLLS